MDDRSRAFDWMVRPSIVVQCRTVAAALCSRHALPRRSRIRQDTMVLQSPCFAITGSQSHGVSPLLSLGSVGMWIP